MHSQRYRAIQIIGAPGTGKGTQGRVLGRLPGFHYFGSGEMLRSLDMSHEIGRGVRQSMERGELVPDDLVISLWREQMEAASAAGLWRPEADLLILDGLPRSIRQAEMLDASAETVKILNLVCRDDRPLIDRLRRRALKEHRLDDADEEVIRHRLEVHRQATAPLLDFYPAELIADIDPLRSPLEVLDQIVHVLIPLQVQE